MKRFLCLLLCLLLLIPTLVYGHSGRTDANGGHWDRKYGTGYHYHHGYPAHQHPNGVCPYEQPQQTQDSEEIKAIQKKLMDLGYDPKGVDGVYGSGTRAAVKQFQKDHGLVADGVCGPMTKAALGL